MKSIIFSTVLIFISLSSPGLSQGFGDFSSAIVRITNDRANTTGSGFIAGLDNDGVVILTAGHVVDGDSSPSVTFAVDPFLEFEAEVLSVVYRPGWELDIALVRVATQDIPFGVSTLRLGEHSLAANDTVQIVGYPSRDYPVYGRPLFAEGKYSAAEGVIEPVPAEKREYQLQIGYSGGPVISEGRVIGIYVGAFSRSSAAAGDERMRRMVSSREILTFLAETDLVGLLGIRAPVPKSNIERFEYLRAASDLVSRSRLLRRRNETSTALLLLEQARAFALRAGVWTELSEQYHNEVQQIFDGTYVSRSLLGPNNIVNRFWSHSSGITYILNERWLQNISQGRDGEYEIKTYDISQNNDLDYLDYSRIFPLDNNSDFLVADHRNVVICSLDIAEVKCEQFLSGEFLDEWPLRQDDWLDVRLDQGHLKVLTGDLGKVIEYEVFGEKASEEIRRVEIATPWLNDDESRECHLLSGPSWVQYTSNASDVLAIWGSGFINVVSLSDRKVNSYAAIRDPKCNDPYNRDNTILDIEFEENERKIGISFADGSIVEVAFSAGWSVEPQVRSIRDECEKINEYERECVPPVVLDFSSDSQFLAAGTADLPGEVLVFDLREQPVKIFERQDGHTQHVSALSFLGDSLDLVTRGSGGGDSEQRAALRLWQFQDQVLKVQSQDDRAKNLVFDPSGQYFLVATHNSSVAELFDSNSGRRIAEIDMRLVKGLSISDSVGQKTGERHSFSPSFVGGVETIVSGSIWGRVSAWKTVLDPDGLPIGEYSLTDWLQVPLAEGVWIDDPSMTRSAVYESLDFVLFCDDEGYIHKLAFSNEKGKFGASSRLSPEGGVFRDGDHSDRSVYDCQGLEVYGDGEFIVAAGGGAVLFRRLNANEEIYETLRLDTSGVGEVFALALDRRGYIAVGGSTGLLSIFDARANLGENEGALQPVTSFPAHATSIRSVDFDASSTLLAIGGQDQYVTILDVETPERPRVVRDFFVEDPDGVGVLKFSPTDNLLVSVTHNTGQLLLWPIGQVWELPCDFAKRNLTLDEWNQHIASTTFNLDYERTCEDFGSGRGAPKDAPAALPEN